jgi:hypothetical protein
MATVPPTASNASATIPMRQVVPSATSLASSRPVIPRDWLLPALYRPIAPASARGDISSPR